MLSRGRPTHARARGEGRGTWIWLPGGAAVVAAVLALLVVARGTPPCQRGPVRHPGHPAVVLAARALMTGHLPAVPRFAVTGTARFYVPDTAAGACDLGPFQRDGVYASLSPGRFARGAECGTYLHVRGPRGEILAEVVDLCPLCAGDGINLSRTAFAMVAPTRHGSARVRYWPATDPLLSSPLALRGFQTAGGYPALQVLNHGNRITSVDIAAAGRPGRRWHAMRLSSHDLWVAWGRRTPARVTIRLSDDRGHTAVIPGVRLRPGHVFRSGVWMYSRGPHVTVIPPAATLGGRRPLRDTGAGLIITSPQPARRAPDCQG